MEVSILLVFYFSLTCHCFIWARNAQVTFRRETANEKKNCYLINTLSDKALKGTVRKSGIAGFARTWKYAYSPFNCVGRYIFKFVQNVKTVNLGWAKFFSVTFWPAKCNILFNYPDIFSEIIFFYWEYHLNSFIDKSNLYSV